MCIPLYALYQSQSQTAFRHLSDSTHASTGSVYYGSWERLLSLITSTGVINKPLCYEVCFVTILIRHCWLICNYWEKTSARWNIKAIKGLGISRAFTGYEGMGRQKLTHMPSTPLLLPASQHQIVLFVVNKYRPKKLHSGLKHPKMSVFQRLI